jgi:V/A-type H+-transporting ATPase subunit I
MIDTYLSRYEIHLENALSELKTVKDLRPYQETNPYKEELAKMAELQKLMEQPARGAAPKDRQAAPAKPAAAPGAPSVEDAVKLIAEMTQEVQALLDRQKDLEAKEASYQELLDKIKPFVGLEYDVAAILRFKYIRFRFGRIAKEYYDKFVNYVYDTIDTVFCKCQEDGDYVWGVYFVPEPLSEKVDAIYASMHFERTFLPDEYEGTPSQSTAKLTDAIAALQKEREGAQASVRTLFDTKREAFDAACRKLGTYAQNFDIRKLAACTKQEVNTFYILCGWMAHGDALRFRAEIADDANVFAVVEDDHSNLASRPPTKLHNLGLFRPFETFTQMYGLPAYNELDPTLLIALTYSALFGFMFGDLGQGFLLFAGGVLLYYRRKLNLAAIVSCCGISSMIFGLLFGSVFGFEDVLPALWMRPTLAMSQLPLLGKLNTVFIVAISLGMVITLFTMVLNIINSLKSRNMDKLLFDHNGFAGLVFYGALALTVFSFIAGLPHIAAAIAALLFGVPLAAIFLKEPLTAIVEKKAEKMPKEKAMFFVQNFFELFEVLLSYFSNTLSFVRVGAFAISHAAMMEVVFMLAGAESGHLNPLVVVLGNLFVCGMEGLIVGIQVLRLEYYELFSRFYQGTGRSFIPYSRKPMI